MHTFGMIVLGIALLLAGVATAHRSGVEAILWPIKGSRCEPLLMIGFACAIIGACVIANHMPNFWQAPGWAGLLLAMSVIIAVVVARFVGMAHVRSGRTRSTTGRDCIGRPARKPRAHRP